MSPYDRAIVLAGMLLQGMVISTMLKGAVRRYPFVFSYVVFSFLSSVVQYSFWEFFGRASRQYIRAYWIVDFVGTVLVLMIIIHLIRAAMEGHRHRGTVYWGLLGGVLITAAVAARLLTSGGRSFSFSRLLTEVGRDYYFGAVLLNLILWTTLIKTNHWNKQIYLLASGLGLKLTGAAIAHAMRLAAVGPSVVANQILVITYLLSLYIWYFALKRVPAPDPLREQVSQRV